MAFTFTVHLLKQGEQELTFPRVENVDYRMAFGQAKNLDLALKEATLNMLSWLQKDYGLSIEEAS